MTLSWPPGVARIVCDELDSTNSEAARRAQAGEGPLWVLAHAQTAGRGRRGRAWKAADRGNFAASFLMRPEGPVGEWAQVSFVAALALHDVISGLAPRAQVRLKWPNDVLVGGQKISGILLETEGDALITGIGVNLVASPQDEPGATCLAAAQGASPSAIPSAEAFLDMLAPAFAQRLARHAAAGFAATRADWLARATGVGGPIVARLPGAEHRGVFEDVDETGALVLRKDSDRLVLAAAEVYFGEEG